MSLNDASFYGNLTRVKQLLAAGADPNIADNHGNTPLHHGSYNGHLEVVKKLLRGSDDGVGADPNIVNMSDKTPLLWASRNGHLEVVRELLSVGADPNIADNNGDIAAGVAAGNRKLKIVEELENYFPSLHILSLRSLRKFGIMVSSIPKNLLK